MSKEKNTSDIVKLKIGEYDCYVAKNKVGAWLAYIDVTDFKELHTNDCYSFDYVLPFHGGCTFSGWTRTIAQEEMWNGQDHFLIGCDWCHGQFVYHSSPYVKPTYEELCGIENASFEDVKKNLEEVVSFMPELLLKAVIKGGMQS